MKIGRGEIKLINLQIKSIDKARDLCMALQTIEEECGIHEVRITIENPFICPWIDLNELMNTDMERLVSGILNKLK